MNIREKQVIGTDLLSIWNMMEATRSKELGRVGQGRAGVAGALASINHFIPKNDQCQIFPTASPVILHQTVWKT